MLLAPFCRGGGWGLGNPNDPVRVAELILAAEPGFEPEQSHFKARTLTSQALVEGGF